MTKKTAYPCALTIAGSDCSGGAGVQADLKTFSALGVYGMSAIVSVVAENTCRVIKIEDISPETVKAQIDAVFEDIPPQAVKVGMLSGTAQMEAVAERLRFYAPAHAVVDPVMVAKGGCALMQPEALKTMIRAVIPLSEILTPNIPEAEALTGLSIQSRADMQKAAEKIRLMGAGYVLLKGGHLTGSADDLLWDGKTARWYESPRIDTRNTHGTGCTFSSAIAAYLALGYPVPEAVKRAKEYVTGAIAHALALGKGHGPTNHFWQYMRQNEQ